MPFIFQFILIIGLLNFAVMTSSCNKGRGSTVENKLDLAPFHSFDHRIRDNVFIEQGNRQEVLILGQKNVVENLSTSVVNGVWTIDFEKKPKLYRNMTIYITLPQFETMKINGPGIVRSQSAIRQSAVRLEARGSGNFSIQLDVDRLESEADNASVLFLTGRADAHQCILNDGRLRGSELRSKVGNFEVKLNSIAEVWCTDSLFASIPNNGTLRFKGNPDTSFVKSSSAIVEQIP